MRDTPCAPVRMHSSSVRRIATSASLFLIACQYCVSSSISSCSTVLVAISNLLQTDSGVCFTPDGVQNEYEDALSNPHTRPGRVRVRARNAVPASGADLSHRALAQPRVDDRGGAQRRPAGVL